MMHVPVIETRYHLGDRKLYRWRQLACWCQNTWVYMLTLVRDPEIIALLDFDMVKRKMMRDIQVWVLEGLTKAVTSKSW